MRLDFALFGAAAAAVEYAEPLTAWMQHLMDLLQERGYRLKLATTRPTGGAYTPEAWAAATAALGAGRLDGLSISTDGARRRGRCEVMCMGFADRRVWQGVARVLVSVEYAGWCLGYAEASGASQGLVLPLEPPRLFATQTRVEAQLFQQLATHGRQGLDRMRWSASPAGPAGACGSPTGTWRGSEGGGAWWARRRWRASSSGRPGRTLPWSTTTSRLGVVRQIESLSKSRRAGHQDIPPRSGARTRTEWSGSHDQSPAAAHAASTSCWLHSAKSASVHRYAWPAGAWG